MLHDLEEVDALGYGVDELVEQVHDLGTRALQLRDDLHSCDEALALRLEVLDLDDLLVDLGNLRTQDLVAALLRARPALHRELGQVHDAGGDDQRAREGDEEFFLAPLAKVCAPGQ